MAAINICRDNKDPFYRYKMPPIVSKIEGRGNGIKTAVVNTSDVARSLSRPPSYVIKYFGFELGSLTNFSEDTDRYIVNGAHDAARLQDLLDGFISKFVLCGSCKNPETDISLHKDGTLTKDCKACGQRTMVDPRHKLSGYILKNPPATAKGKKKAATASAKVGGGSGITVVTSAEDDKSKSNGAEDGGENDDDGENSDDELTRRINAEASTLPDVVEADDDDDKWAADVSEEAVKARQAVIEKNLAVLNLDEDHVDDTVYNEFGEWIEAEERSDVDIYQKAVSLGVVSKHKTVQVLARTLLNSEDILEEIDEHEGLFSKLIDGSEKHEKSLLGGIEYVVGVEHPDLIKAVPKILFSLYDSDLISEDVVREWGSKASKKYVDKDISKQVRRAAKPFLEWLDKAESDSDSD